MPAQNIVDGLITFRILHMLVTPWTSTPAFKYGIIDKDGNPLKRSSELRSSDEQAAYSVLWRLVFKLKRILGKVPIVNKNLTNFAAALWLIKEYDGLDDDSMINEELFEEVKTKDLSYEIKMIKEFVKLHPNMELVNLILEEVPANNVSGGEISGTEGEVIKKQPPRIRRFGEYKRKKAA